MGLVENEAKKTGSEARNLNDPVFFKQVVFTLSVSHLQQMLLGHRKAVNLVTDIYCGWYTCPSTPAIAHSGLSAEAPQLWEATSGVRLYPVPVPRKGQPSAKNELLITALSSNQGTARAGTELPMGLEA